MSRHLAAVFELKTCQFENWLRDDLWEARQAGFILNGYEPPEVAELRPVQDFYAGAPLGWGDFFSGAHDRMIEREVNHWKALTHLRAVIRGLSLAVTSGALSAVPRQWGDEYLRPAAAVRWAVGKGYTLPPELAPLASGIAPTELTPLQEGAAYVETAPPLPGKSVQSVYQIIAALWVLNYGDSPTTDTIDALVAEFVGDAESHNLPIPTDPRTLARHLKKAFAMP